MTAKESSTMIANLQQMLNEARKEIYTLKDELAGANKLIIKLTKEIEKLKNK